MSTTIYNNGSYIPKRPLTEDDVKAVEEIKDGWGQQAFIVDEDGNVTFRTEDTGGINPFEADIYRPVVRLLELAKKRRITLSGDINLSSTGEHDHTILRIEDGEIQILDSNLVNASTEELADELKRRGFEVGMKKVYKLTLSCFYKKDKLGIHPNITEIRRPTLKEVWDAYQDFVMHHDMAVYTPYKIMSIDEEPAA